MMAEYSGNRGRCAQPCRKPYTLVRGDADEYGRPRRAAPVPLADQYLLSTRDLSLYPYLERVILAPVVALKIEASPFTSLIIILLGIPFALMMRRRSTGVSSLGISIFVGFLYYIIDAISIALGKGGMIPPILAASLSHFIALGTSLYLIANMP